MSDSGRGSKRRGKGKGGKKSSKGSKGGRTTGGDSDFAAKVKKTLKGAGASGIRTKDLAKKLGIKAAAYQGFRKTVRRLADEGAILRIRGGRYASLGAGGRMEGILSVTKAGDGFVRPVAPEDSEKGDSSGVDIFIPANALGPAMSGDRVKVRIDEHPPGRSPVGVILEVESRRRSHIIGRYDRVQNFGFVVPVDPKVRRDILVPAGEEGAAVDGDAVAVSISVQGTRNHGPLGTVTQVLGRADDPEVEIRAIALGYDFNPEFPEEVEAAAEAVAIKPLGDRMDLRDSLVLTIDPEDARDHDDAISLVSEDENGWRVGVHIADVSHYVEAGSVVDEEAKGRGTSVYMVDRVIPMLPHRLSSDVCSLVPNEDRAAVSVFLTITKGGEIVDTKVHRSVIRSRFRLSYEAAEAVLDRTSSMSSEVDELLRTLNAAAGARRQARLARGSLDFDFPEAKVILGEDGAPVDILKSERLEAHRLIEDMMLAANEAVARLSIKRNVPVPFRVHEGPSGKGLENLQVFLASAGHAVTDEPTPLELRRLLEAFETSPLKSIVQTAVLRSLKRAQYSADHKGHFGLAAEAYLHFTSPIRRYPDLLAHRHILCALVDGKRLPEPWVEGLSHLCRISSDREREADEAQRDSVALKQVEYMERHLGERFFGTITGVTAFGFFVTLQEVYVEGLVHVSSLDDDFYEHVENEFALAGRRHGRRFVIGDEVEVTVSLVDKKERRIDLVLASESKNKRKAKRKRA